MRAPVKLRDTSAEPGTTIAVLAIACAAVIFSTVVSLINMNRRIPLPLVAMVPYGGGGAKAQMAAMAAPPKGTDRSEREKGRVFAAAALRDDPMSVIAVRTLAILAAMDGRDAQASRLLAYAERLSRRDLPTQLMLIETAVSSGDVDEALRHYDRALRVSPKATEFLLPILDQAAADPVVRMGLIAMLRQRPPWRPWLLSGMAGDPAASSFALADILARLQLDLRDEHDHQIVERALARLVADRHYGRAYRLYRYVLSGAPGLLRNGDFEAEPLLAPFDWTMAQTPGVIGIREPVAASGGHALSIVADEGQGGEVARQLLVLPPATYTMSMAAGGIGEDRSARPSIRIECPGADHPLGRAAAPVSVQRAMFDMTFTVPQDNCSAQWLVVAVDAGLDKGTATPWLDRFSIRRK